MLAALECFRAIIMEREKGRRENQKEGCVMKMVDAFALAKIQRNNQQNALAVEARQGENRRKRLYFHRTVEMKQPHT